MPNLQRSSPMEWVDDGASAAPLDLDEQFRAFAARASGVGREAADIAGALEDLNAAAQLQQQGFATLNGEAQKLTAGNQLIQRSTVDAEKVAREARSAVGAALDGTKVLAQAVHSVSEGIDAVTYALSSVSDAARDIGSIAFQTRLLAFNASVEAVRAGAQGRGFGVVAQAIKDLAQQAQESSALISRTISDLGLRVDELSRSTRVEGNGATGGASDAAVERATAAFHQAFDAVQREIVSIRQAADANMQSCEVVARHCDDLVAGVERSGDDLARAKARAQGLLTISEELIEGAASCGMETADTPYIEAIQQAAAQVAELFEEGIADGALSLEDLFDVQYRPIAGTNPEQFSTRYVAFTDRVLPQIQESMLQMSHSVVFCAAVDRNGYLPTHNLKFSKPQGRDPAWNAANSRNRRIFADRTGLGAARNNKPFLLQTYRRDMGGGNFVLMKDLSAPIIVAGRHWGGLRFAYRFDEAQDGL